MRIDVSLVLVLLLRLHLVRFQRRKFLLSVSKKSLYEVMSSTVGLRDTFFFRKLLLGKTFVCFPIYSLIW